MSPSTATLIAICVSAIASWALTVPLHRFKELRPKSPRDIDAEVGDGTSPPQVVRAAYRRALCPDCHHRYRSTDVVPLVSWIRGCPGCGRRLPVTVPVTQIGIPVATAMTMFTLRDLHHGALIAIPFVCLVIALGAISVVDLRIWLIPYWMPWSTSAVGLVTIASVSLYTGQPGAIVRAIVSGSVMFGLFFLLWAVAPSKLGFGDVRLSLVIGMFLGWLGPVLPVYGILFGSLLALVIGLASMATGRGDRFAFGPALSLGTLSAVWLAPPLLGW